MTAQDREGALRELYERGFVVSGLEARQEQRAVSALPPPPGMKGLALYVPLMRRCAFWRQGAQCVKAGLSLPRTFELLGGAAHGPLSSFCRRNLPQVTTGTPLSELMHSSPHLFSPIEHGLIRAGEASGRIDREMNHLAEYFEQEMAIWQKLRFRIAYMGCVGFVMLFVGFVLAVMAPFLSGALGPKSLVDATLRYLLPLGVAIAVLVALRAFHLTSGMLRAGIDRLKLLPPVVGSLYRTLAIARFTCALSHLVEAGVPVQEGFEVAAQTAGNIHLTRTLLAAAPNLGRGGSIADVLASTGQIPLQVVQMVRSGEETGSVDEMLGKVSEYYQGEASAATMTLVTVGSAGLLFVLLVAGGAQVVGFWRGYFANLFSVLGE